MNEASLVIWILLLGSDIINLFMVILLELLFEGYWLKSELTRFMQIILFTQNTNFFTKSNNNQFDHNN